MTLTNQKISRLPWDITDMSGIARSRDEYCLLALLAKGTPSLSICNFANDQQNEEKYSELTSLLISNIRENHVFCRRTYIALSNVLGLG